MGTINSACGSCFGETSDQVQTDSTTIQKQNEQSNFSGFDNIVKRFSFTSKEFELIKVLVKGSFGKILLVRRKSDNKLLILKILKKKDVGVKNLLGCTIDEKGLIKDIEHPFILHLQDSYHDHARVYLLTEFCPGGNLTQRIKKDGKFDLSTAKIYAAELVLAIQYIHESLNMIHRDINPENILFASDYHFRITEFGISKTQVKGITRYGTPNYLAPEVISGLVYGPEVDWWSLGCLIYFMLVGQSLFEHQKPTEFEESISKDSLELPAYFSNELKDLLTKLLTRNPEERLGSKGAQEIKNHPFFKDVDWNAVLNREFTPSFKLPIIEEEEITDDQEETTDRDSEECPSGQQFSQSGHFTSTQSFLSKESITETKEVSSFRYIRENMEG